MQIKVKAAVLTLLSLVIFDLIPAQAVTSKTAALVVKPIQITSVAIDGSVAHLSWAAPALKKGDTFIIAVLDSAGKLVTTSFRTKELTYALSISWYQTYKVQLRSLLGAKNTWSSIATFKTFGPAVKNLTETSSSYTSVTFQWDKTTNATTYLISIDSGTPKPWSLNTYTLTGLTPGYRGLVTITPIANGISGVTSDPLSISTDNTAPANLVASKASESGYTLSWSSVQGATSYNIYSDGKVVANATTTSYTFANLTMGSTQKYTVRGVFGKAETLDSLPVIASTLINTPLVPVVTVTGGTTATVNWAANANVKNYQLSIFDSSGTVSIKLITLDPSLTSYTVTGLSPASSYTAGIQYVYATATSAMSSLATFVTPAPAPSGLMSTAITSTSFLLGWTPSPGAYAYDIYRDGFLITTVKSIDTTVSSYQFYTLTPGVTYSITMKAYYYDNSKNTVVSASSPALAVSVLTDPAVRPINSVIPAITLPYASTPIIGATLSGTNGLWTSQALLPTYSYQWQKSVDGGVTFNDIPSATQSSYLVASTDFGFYLRYKVTASNVNGSTVAYSSPTNPVNSVYNAGAPVIFGNSVVGQTLQTTDGTWSSNYQTSFTYQWNRAGYAISGANSPSYTLTNSDIGAIVSVTVTASTTLGNASVTTAGRGGIAVLGNTFLPVISGVARAGSTLSTSNGTWIGVPDTITYQWQSSSDGSVWSLISGATSASYVLVPGDVGQIIRAQVFGSKTISGVTYKYTALTVPTTQIPALTLSNTAQPSITGSWAVGSTLTATNGTWSSIGTISYQWQSSSDGATWSNISGATSATYLLAGAQNGLNIRVQVQNSTTGGDGLAYSAYTPKVGSPICSVTPVVSGTLRVGSVQTVTTGTWSTTPNYAYQWQKTSDGIAWTNIGSATSASYTPTFDVANLNIRVVVSAGNAMDTVTVTSNIVSNFLPPQATSIPVISGTATSGQTLTASSGTWPSTVSGYNYQWQRSSDGVTWVNISSATSSTYVLAPADVGYVVRVQVSLTTNAGTSAAYSLATAAVS